MPEDDDKKAEPQQPYTSSDVKPATEFPPDPPPRPGQETRPVTPYRQGYHGESGSFPGGVVKDFRPHVLPSDAEEPEVEAEPAPKDSSVQESAESSSETESPETTQAASPSPEKIAAKAVVKGNGLNKAGGNSSQTSSTAPKKKSGSSSQPAQEKPQTDD